MPGLVNLLKEDLGRHIQIEEEGFQSRVSMLVAINCCIDVRNGG